ncbi:DUF565 domain-containing protein [Synechococcus sp. HK05]|jgi:hypothetical protein|uniref:DUF565 domain-containing protein n=1 Tax=Synechococcus sp. HK05 TaxID=2725975 RepID=UPI001C386102|nr:DUF565 domain-containing protein [Synechococcus sp. HK05]MBV2351060.1 DUF565 domain-containing protein [Synechococcus sp. HK05]
MTLPLQRTRLDGVQRRAGELLLGGFRGSWRRRSLAVLALLLGFYAGENVTALWLERVGQRPVVVLTLVLMLELLVRLRTRLVGERPGLGWIVTDNLRLGVVYAVVLEAFKLGS